MKIRTVEQKDERISTTDAIKIREKQYIPELRVIYIGRISKQASKTRNERTKTRQVPNSARCIVISGTLAGLVLGSWSQQDAVSVCLLETGSQNGREVFHVRYHTVRRQNGPHGSAHWLRMVPGLDSLPRDWVTVACLRSSRSFRG